MLLVKYIHIRLILPPLHERIQGKATPGLHLSWRISLKLVRAQEKEPFSIWGPFPLLSLYLECFRVYGIVVADAVLCHTVDGF